MQLAHVEKIYGAHVSDIKVAAENQRHRMLMEVEAAKAASKRNQQDLIKWQKTIWR